MAEGVMYDDELDEIEKALAPKVRQASNLQEQECSVSADDDWDVLDQVEAILAPYEPTSAPDESRSVSSNPVNKSLVSLSAHLDNSAALSEPADNISALSNPVDDSPSSPRHACSPAPPAIQTESVGMQTEEIARQISVANPDLSDYLRFLYDAKKHEEKHGSINPNRNRFRRIVQDIMRESISDMKSQASLGDFKDLLVRFDSDDDELVQHVSNGVFMARVKIKDAFPPGTFQLKRDAGLRLPDGQGVLELNSSALTRQEKAHVMKNTFLLDGEHLSPHKTSILIHKGLMDSLKKRQNTVMRDYIINLDPQLKDGEVTIKISAEHQDKIPSKKFSIMVYVIPAILISGWPKAVTLQNPFPRQQPYNTLGHTILKATKEAIDNEVQLICLEGTVTNSPHHQETTHIGQDVRPQTAGPQPQVPRSSIWNISFQPMEKYILGKLLKYDFMKDARIGYEVLGFIREYNPHWHVLTAELRRKVLFEMVKIKILETPAEWFLAFVGHARSYFKSGRCPQYLQNRVDMFDGIDKECFSDIGKAFAWIHQNIKDQPEFLVKLCE